MPRADAGLVVDLLDAPATCSVGGVHPAAGHPARPRSRRGRGWPRPPPRRSPGLGDPGALGHGPVGVADADRARWAPRCARPGRPRPPGGRRQRCLPAARPRGRPPAPGPAAAPLRPVAGPRGRPTPGGPGKAPRVERAAGPGSRTCHRLVLGHEEELAGGDEGGEAEVGEGPVHRGQDDRALGRDVGAAESPGAGTTRRGSPSKMARADPVADGSARVGLEGHPPGGRAPRSRPRWPPSRSSGLRLLGRHSHDSTSSTTSSTLRPVVSSRWASAA